MSNVFEICAVMVKKKTSKLSRDKILLVGEGEDFYELKAYNFRDGKWGNAVSKMKKEQLHKNYEVQ